MKRFIMCAVVLMSATTQLFSQAMRPTIMVMPSDLWCYQNGYYTEHENMGDVERVSDYKRALSSDMEMNLAIAKIGELMSDNGYPLKDLASVLKSLDVAALEKEHMALADGGIAESSLDQARATAKADIIIELSYEISKEGYKPSVIYSVKGVDAYTEKQVAASSGVDTKGGGASPAMVLINSTMNNIRVFSDQLMAHFTDLHTNGREVVLECKVANYSMVNFDSQVGDDLLGFIIEDWVAANTQEGRYSTTDATEFVLKFDQVRIPMFAENGRAIDTRTWARGLMRELMTKYKVRCTLGMRGLGQAYIIITGPM